MNAIKINIPAIWRPIPEKSLSIRAYSKYKFVDSDGFIKEASKSDQVYRYAKNFDINDDSYSILMISKETNTNKIEEFLNDTAERIGEEFIKNMLDDENKAFVYLEEKYEEQ